MKIYSPTITGSAANTNVITVSQTGSLTALSASFASTASSADNLTVRGTLTAQTINVQTITSSIDFVTGSARFGSLAENTHQFTGSVFMSGSLGIGTSSPSGKLVVIGANSNTYLSIDNAASGENYFAANNFHAFQTSGSERVRITAAGNVGIGTTSPSQLLEVVGGEIKAGRVDSTNEGGQVSFGRATDNNTAWYIDAYGNVASPQLRFVDVTGAAVRMTLTGSNVGIGTSSPLSILHINGLSGTAGLPSLLLYGESPSSGQRYGFNVSTDQLDISALGGSARIAFFTGGAANSINERMRITSGGALLMTKNNIIGANTSDGSDDGYLFVCSAGASGASRGSFIQLFGNEYSGDSGVLQLCGGNNSGAGYINFRTGDANDRMRISYNGSIGAPSGTNIYNASDIRLKQNISTTTYGLDTISLLNPVKFNWIDGFEPSEDGKDMLGFVAQEVQEIIPEAIESFGGNSITVGDTVIDNPLRVNEKFIIPVLVKAIQELKSENDTLKEILQRNNIQ